MTLEQVKQKAGVIAMGTFLSEWPDDWDFDKVQEVLSEADEEFVWEHIAIWQPFEHHSPYDVSGYIQDLYDTVVHQFNQKEVQK